MTKKRTVERLQQVLAWQIREFHNAAGLTQEQLAERADIAPQYLSRLGTGRRLPSLQTVAELAAALGTTPSALLMEPREGDRAELIGRVVATFDALTREDAAFLESELARWISHLRSVRQEF